MYHHRVHQDLVYPLNLDVLSNEERVKCVMKAAAWLQYRHRIDLRKDCIQTNKTQTHTSSQ